MDTLSSARTCHSTDMRLATSRVTEFLDLTDRLERFVAETGIDVGTLNIQTRHTTTAIVVNEHEPLLLADFERAARTGAPRGVPHTRTMTCRFAAACLPMSRATGTRIAVRCCSPHRRRSTWSTAGLRSDGGNASSWWNSTARASVRFRSCSLARRRCEGEDDPAGADRGDQPLLAPDQVFALPAARPGDAGRLPGRRRPRWRSRTSTSRRSIWRMHRTWS